jgi:hypothetical protein
MGKSPVLRPHTHRNPGDMPANAFRRRNTGKRHRRVSSNEPEIGHCEEETIGVCSTIGILHANSRGWVPKPFTPFRSPLRQFCNMAPGGYVREPNFMRQRQHELVPHFGLRRARSPPPGLKWRRHH